MAQEEPQHKKEQPIIIKKKRAHADHGHHGGAWKVAYADFVTAMMAFFIVMWILAASKPEVKMAINNYFNNPPPIFESTTGGTGDKPIDLGAFQKGNAKKSMWNDNSIAIDSSTMSKIKKEVNKTVKEELIGKALEDSAKAAKRVKDIGDEIGKYIKEQIAKKPELKEILSSLKIEMTKEGLRIELVESKESLFFELGSAKVKPQAKIVLMELAKQIGKLPNFVEIEGHTDQRQYSNASGYTNWELSSDRANSARHILEQSGLWENQVAKVTGFADRKLRTPDNPFDISNRRVSILIKQMDVKTFLQTAEVSGEHKNE